MQTNLGILNNATFRLATPEDDVLPAFDFTKLTAINTCPRWGLIRYDQHKRMPGEGRAMSLEMGQAAHEAFAAIRLYELVKYGPDFYSIPEFVILDLYIQTGLRLYGEERFKRLDNIIRGPEDERQTVNSIIVDIIDSGGFYDDPSDRRRTVSNLETALFAYADRHEFGNWLPYVDVEKGLVGIEIPINIVITFGDPTGTNVDDDGVKRIRYVGKIDALTTNGKKLKVEENKTASRLGQPWEDSWTISHQPTGYCVAASLLVDQPVREAVIKGLAIPLPKSYDNGGVVNVPLDRDNYRINEWLRWIYQTVTRLYLPYKEHPLYAPEFTHSCNRYFRTCSFMPLCAMASPEEREMTFSQMVTDEWNPLHERQSD